MNLLPNIKSKYRWVAVSASVAALLAWAQPFIFASSVAAASGPLPQGRVPFVNPSVMSLLSTHGPSLLTVGIIGLTAYAAVLVSNRIFGLIDRQRLMIPGFPTLWAKPTAFLLDVALISVAIVAALPYLSLVDTWAFQGVSIFLGGLLAIGSVTLMGNIVAGLALMYGRTFAVGDRIKIGDVVGDVVEQTLLVTRLRTLKNRMMAMPNSVILSSPVENLSDDRWADAVAPVVLHTTLQISYRFPWRKVHAALIQAAVLTEDVLATPEPFVMQKSLGTAAATYELNAYTDQPLFLDAIQSELHQNIQDVCNEAGIELIAPDYSAVRDGSDPAMPEDYFSIQDLKPGARAGFSRQWFGALTSASAAEADLEPVDEYEEELDAEIRDEYELDAGADFDEEVEITAEGELEDADEEDFEIGDADEAADELESVDDELEEPILVG